MKIFIKTYNENIIKTIKSKTFFAYILGLMTFYIYMYFEITNKYYLIEGQVRLLESEEILTRFFLEAAIVLSRIVAIALVWNAVSTIYSLNKKS